MYTAGIGINRTGGAPGRAALGKQNDVVVVGAAAVAAAALQSWGARPLVRREARGGGRHHAPPARFARRVGAAGGAAGRCVVAERDNGRGGQRRRRGRGGRYQRLSVLKRTPVAAEKALVSKRAKSTRRSNAGNARVAVNTGQGASKGTAAVGMLARHMGVGDYVRLARNMG